MGIYASEVWKDVHGYEDRYEVSNLGRVRSKSYLKHTRNMHGDFSYMTEPKLMMQSLNASGYFTIDLCKNKSRRVSLVHRLVAKAFVPNSLDLPIVNHLDSDRVNNAATNLEWTTQQGNVQHSYDSGSNSNAGELHPRHVLTEDIVRKMRAMHKEGSTYRMIAAHFGFREDTTKSAVTGKNWGHVV